ncbi:hypothetical protein [Arthrobacter globiformis]|uniref:Alpha/beta hydrolase n=1 Tax=Arthrobacter globiformis TaxID=1665 RepID=A0A328HEC6_ARTGO|nr:hypothetical protein [Arthrobacter globiformis]RAM35670.1 hypothetical protein DBZ45_18740 [Arthrobacter globiformis]
MSDSPANHNHPVVFIHSLWLHCSSCDPWLEKFRSHGCTAIAPAWPGDGATAGNELFKRWSIPGSGRPLLEDAAADLFQNSPAAVDTHKAERGPLVLTSGTEDNTAPRIVVEQTFKLYADNPKSVADYHELEGREHSLTIDKGWDDVADVTLRWLSSKGC